MGRDHDTILAEEVGLMYKLGCFKEQFLIYAACFQDNGERMYFLSDYAQRVYQFCDEKRKADIFCTPVFRYAKSERVPSGAKATFKQRMKIEAGKQLAAQGAGEAAEILTGLACPANNVAAPLLERIKEKLIGCYEKNILQLFEGLLEYAYSARKINALTFVNYDTWLKQIYRELEQEKLVRDVHERIYYGFGYFNENGVLSYYYNAVPFMVLERRQALLCQKAIVSPVIKKRYHFNQIELLNSAATDFRNLLRHTVDKNYMAILRYIYDLPSQIDQERFMQVYHQTEQQDSPLSIQTLNYYGSLWHIW